MKVKIDGHVREFEDVEELEEYIDEIVEDARQDGYDDGYDDGHDAGRKTCVECDCEDPNAPDNRTTEMRLDLYRAIYRGDMEAAEDMANMMAMVDIDRDLIFAARTEVRRAS